MTLDFEYVADDDGYYRFRRIERVRSRLNERCAGWPANTEARGGHGI